MHDIRDLNTRLWVWIEQVYHQRPHEGLEGKTPLEVWRKDLTYIKQPLTLLNAIYNLPHIHPYLS